MSNKNLKDDFEKFVTNWQEAEPEELAKHFHKLVDLPKGSDSPANAQFQKANSFPFYDFQELQDKADRVTMIKIWMAFEGFNKRKIGFEPFLEVFYTSDTDPSKTDSFILKSDPNQLVVQDTQKVPKGFIENTTALWQDLESEQLPAVFETQTPTGPKQRVQYYVVEGNGLEQMKSLFPTMTGLSILPGLDLNKSVNMEDTIFIPIVYLNVPIEKIEVVEITDGHFTGVHWLLDDDDGGVGFDFNNPCPPFCN